MNPAAKEQWIAALTSGKYKQGVGKLRDDYENYCCLGVLCEIAVQNNIIPPGVPRGYDHEERMSGYEYGREKNAFGLPAEVVAWAGTNGNDSEKDIELSQLNDNGSTFVEIAKVIKEEF